MVTGQRNLARKDFQHAKRIVIKMGTSVVSTNGEPALGRLASLVEQVSMLKRQGKEVLLVTSGSIGIGRKKLHKQLLLSASLRMHVQGGTEQHHALDAKKGAMAAAGQVGLMALYETLFSMYDVACSQVEDHHSTIKLSSHRISLSPSSKVLVTEAEFRTPEHRANIRDTLLHLLDMDVLPIVNENDAISAGLYRDEDGVFTDNDSLAALIAGETSANLLVLLTDVDGVFDKPPTEPHAKVLSVFGAGGPIVFGEKSSVGRGGMQAKIRSAQRALAQGVNAVVIASGFKYGILDSIMKGTVVGTLFVPNPSALTPVNSPEDMAVAARDGSRALLELSSAERSRIVLRLSQLLVDESPRILEANRKDLDAASSSLDPQLRSRLKLTHDKLVTLSQGIASVAGQDEPLGRVLSLMEVSSGLVLEQVTAPIGVLLVVFESRPDSLPQIAALALRSGNGLLLKGGKEAKHSNACLHALVQDAIRLETSKVPPSVVGLVTTRDDVGALLALDHVVDLCIPRGSNSLVSHIKKNTRIPVLGHAEGVCHVYIHDNADLVKATKVAVDAKTDYPAACNALETLLIDEAIVQRGAHHAILDALVAAGVTLYEGPRAAKLHLVPGALAAPSLSHEYGSLGLTVEVVAGGVDGAMAHINRYSSGHTECIITEDAAVAETFLNGIDSACVFHNASTRFADGFRFGLGAEVGISTGRIHARGPVGVQGLLTTKWKLRSANVHTVAAFGQGGTDTYTHKTLHPTTSKL
ncbi:hypothetical protein DYB37_013446 [Aphanomyces astaci]|uniref:Delta-1-pyrroline-5-carboxylate synthase n=2 Tax=Aphanomyces astaci TaxID=112090 RepID=A0A418FRS8_APHAT|nr:hypothetical protein DYB37_013446 [Aphanomyces astaci]